MKVCKKCNKKKPNHDFYKHPTGRDGFMSSCMVCVREYQRSRTNKIYKPTGYIPHSSTKKYRKEASMKFRVKNFEKNMLLATKSSAKKRCLDFNLDLTDIIIPEFCPYLNIKLTRSVGKGLIDSNPSIDRINNNLGYVKGNIEIISRKANAMKRDASIHELVVFAKNIIKKHSK